MKVKGKKKMLLPMAVAFMSLVFASCGESYTCESVQIVPKPQSVVMGKGTYAMKLSKSYTPKYVVDETMVPEAYRLSITRRGITITSSTEAGRYYANVSLSQMIPAEALGSQDKGVRVHIPCCTIDDYPAFAYRGAHLDCCRHFFSVDEVKAYIDILAMHKINRFHWHLTEDQGWRIEIKAYPRLTTVGSMRAKTMVKKEWDHFDDTPYGGFYTQDQAREVVAYAAERHITVIPEIEIPGHALAALASYPELGCRGEGYEVSPTWGIFPDVCCPGKEETFKFWETVLSEIMDIFPSEYIHIGGDECPKDEWKKCPLCQQRIKDEGLADEFELQSYVTRRVEKFLNDHGRQIIGWDEILEGGVTPSATVMSWRGTSGGVSAAKAGNKVIMTPNTYCYLDYYQSQDTSNEPLAIGGYLPVEKTYSFNPYESLTPEQQKYIFGVQGNVWTEYITTFDQVEYMLLPRISAIAEVGWTRDNRDFEDFKARMEHVRTYYDANGWNYCKHMFE